MCSTVAVVLVTAGWLLNGMIGPVVARNRANELPAMPRVAKLSAASAFAVLGGFRPLAADLAWIALQGAWERRDQSASEKLIRTATLLDPASAYFWKNGARMIAFDIPLWRIAESGGWDSMPATRQRAIRREQAAAALRLLNEALEANPRMATLWLERAGIELHGEEDPAAAASSYRRAWELDPSLTFAARLQAQLLRRIGRREEALAGLHQLRRYLAANGGVAEIAMVRVRIDELERELAALKGRRSPLRR